MKYILSFGVCLLLFLSCRKDASRPSCSDLENGLSAADKGRVETAISQMIRSLSSKDYTEENFEKLVNIISSQCNVTVVGHCFDCIKTLPSQSEIYFSIDPANNVRRVVDITYTADNKMKFSNLHD